MQKHRDYYITGPCCSTAATPEPHPLTCRLSSPSTAGRACPLVRERIHPLGAGIQSIIQPPHMIFTGLEDYKARGTQASPYYTITHFTEFAETKDTVLVRGDVVFTSKLTDAEAKRLLETAHSFYLNDVRYNLVERFNKETHDFEFKDVLEALEMPSM
ncbi:uncharacterized protein LOC123448142 [Hordeum vulgare subsp. vulgare]|uniref:uncharacterized protein LOC123448142 n=1 Tax=Hordeum vulgare subsp. vulgare TaxID=112509 RepID=UPI001D1A4F74|nr:uncharacterized protein LOC123448142 [Hordeum vulgare subsp. vulgare]